jgi:long-chain fatty acid transport protein
VERRADRHGKKNLVGVGLVAGLLTVPAAARAAGFALAEQGASGMGNAFAGAAASAEDASTVFFNPAGMGLLPGAQIILAGHAVDFKAKFSDAGSTLPPAGGGVLPIGSTNPDAGGTLFIPNAYFALPVGDKLAFGVGANAPFGLKTEYDDPWIGRFQGINSELTTYNINPAISFKVSPAVLIGVGVNYQHADAELTNAVILAPATEGRAKVDADGNAWGWNAGVLFHLGEDMRIGVSYRSALDYTLEGTTSVTTLAGAPVAPVSGPTKIDITFPDSASLSAVQKFGPQWELLGDITWTHWSEIGTVQAINSTTGAPRDLLEFQFDDAWRLSLGATYRGAGPWTFRGGVAWDQSPVKDEFRTVRLPDADRVWVALGARWQAAGGLFVDVGYAHLFVDDAPINLSRSQLPVAAATTSVVKGSYDSSVDILSLQVGYTF